jgi:hypothetical protein
MRGRDGTGRIAFAKGAHKHALRRHRCRICGTENKGNGGSASHEMAKYTLADFGQQFPDDDACLLYLFDKRYGQHGPVCLTCGKRDRLSTVVRVAGSFACAWCGAQVSPTAGRSSTTRRRR